MMIGILQVDSILPKFEDQFSNYPEMFSELFLAARTKDEHFECTTYDVQAGELPKNIDSCDGYVITGSKCSVYEDLQWIRNLEGFVKQLHAGKRKLVGICFGHQLIANCLGGVADLAEQGWAVGVQTSQIYKKQSAWMSPAPAEISLISSHKDQVSVLPEGAGVFCGNSQCPIGGYAMGDHIITFQGHPEFSAAFSGALINHRSEILGNDITSEGLNSLGQNLDRQLVARWILNFIFDTSRQLETGKLINP